MIFLGILAAVIALFFADRINRQQVDRVLVNAAAGKPALKDVAFVFPLIPHPTPSPTPVPVYPGSIAYENNVTLRYEDLGSGYWQTDAFNMVDGEATTPDDDWQGQFRFKFNPPDDPMHPGHSVVAIAGARSKMAFANLGLKSFYSVQSLARVHWLVPSAGETPAAWNLAPGDVVAMRIETDLTAPVEPAASGSATGSAGLEPTVKVQRLTYAKLFIRMLSQDKVTFDYVFRVDGSPVFPRPHGG